MTYLLSDLSHGQLQLFNLLSKMNVYIGSTLVSEYTCKLADQQNWTLTWKSKWVEICFKWLAGCLMFLANSTSKSAWAWNCTVFTKLSIFTILGIWYFCTRSDWVVNEMNTVPEYCSRPVYPYGFAVIPTDSDLKFRCYARWVKNYGHCPIFPFPHFKLE